MPDRNGGAPTIQRYALECVLDEIKELPPHPDDPLEPKTQAALLRVYEAVRYLGGCSLDEAIGITGRAMASYYDTQTQVEGIIGGYDDEI